MPATALRQTPLFELHRESGARMVDFSGWEMPLHYGSQISEHQQVRTDAGMFDVSHMLAVDVEGERARDFLRRLLANDVARLVAPGSALYSCMLRDDGGILDDLIVYFRAPCRYRIVVNAATAERDIAWMSEQSAAWLDVVLAPRRELAILAVQGPQARARVSAARPQWQSAIESLRAFHCTDVDDAFVARAGYTGEDGVEILLPADQASALWQALREAGVRPCGLGARDTLRLEAGMALYGQDMDETTVPAEVGLGWTVAMQDNGRDFIGRVALMQRPPRFQTLGLVLLEKGVLRGHQNIRSVDTDTTCG